MPTTPNLAIPYPASTDEIADGAQNMQDIADTLDTLLGSAWTTYTPTTTNVTLGNGTITGRHQKVGKTVIMWARLTAGTTTTFTGTPGFSLPFTASAEIRRSMFRVEIADASPLAGYIGAAAVTTTRVDLQVINTAGTYATTTAVSATVPIAIATGDTYEVFGVYQAA